MANNKTMYQPTKRNKEELIRIFGEKCAEKMIELTAKHIEELDRKFPDRYKNMKYGEEPTERADDMDDPEYWKVP